MTTVLSFCWVCDHVKVLDIRTHAPAEQVQHAVKDGIWRGTGGFDGSLTHYAQPAAGVSDGLSVFDHVLEPAPEQQLCDILTEVPGQGTIPHY